MPFTHAVFLSPPQLFNHAVALERLELPGKNDHVTVDIMLADDCYEAMLPAWVVANPFEMVIQIVDGCQCKCTLYLKVARKALQWLHQGSSMHRSSVRMCRVLLFWQSVDISCTFGCNIDLLIHHSSNHSLRQSTAQPTKYCVQSVDKTMHFLHSLIHSYINSILNNHQYFSF